VLRQGQDLVVDQSGRKGQRLANVFDFGVLALQGKPRPYSWRGPQTEVCATVRP
jgi:hypothetical protein